MKIKNQIAAVLALLISQPVFAEEGRLTRLDDGQLILCGTYSAIQTMYALALEGQMQNLSGCWVVDAPLEIIVLQHGERLSSITYREFRGEDTIARLVERGTPEDVVNRIRENPWTPWYQSPAWAFTAWLEPEG